MRKFKDRNGREWEVDLNMTSAKAVKDATGVNVFKLAEDGLAGLKALGADVEALVNCVWVLCRAQAEKAGLTAVDFGEALAGQSIADAGEAFAGAFIDFFPNRGLSAGLQKIEAKAKAAMEILQRDVDAKLDAITPESLAESLKSGHGPPPESSASTPDRTPSAS